MTMIKVGANQKSVWERTRTNNIQMSVCSESGKAEAVTVIVINNVFYFLFNKDILPISDHPTGLDYQRNQTKPDFKTFLVWHAALSTLNNNKNILWTLLGCFITSYSFWFNLFSSPAFLSAFFLPVKMRFILMSWALILISHHFCCGHFLVYYTTLAAYSHSSCKLDIWTDWPWQYGDNEISLMIFGKDFKGSTIDCQHKYNNS